MKIGVIGDDFTGSSDIANTLARAGARTIQYGGIPDEAAPENIDAAVISLKTRSIEPSDAVEQSLAACRWLKANGAVQIVFKYCSTFDSTPRGNIGPVAEALLAELDAPLALVCPAFPENGRTVYQGHLFVGDRLLSESGMEKHPLNPMTDPDIRRWLARQTKAKVGHIALPIVRLGALDRALAEAASRGERLIVADAVADEDLLKLAAAAANHRLVTGGSAIAEGLPRNFGILPERAGERQFEGAAGPALVISGSCSSATRRQVEYHRARRPSLMVDAADAMEAEAALPRILEFVAENRGKVPLVYSSADPEAVTAAQERHGREALAILFERLFAELALAAIEMGFRRIVVAGGETSGAVAGALGPTAFEIGPEIAPGVPALLRDGEPRLALALKSGNFGTEDFFERAVAVLGGESL